MPPVVFRYSELKVTVVFVGAQPGATWASLLAAATYGPTNGPPLPTGAAPAGSIEVVEVSVIARPRLRRPLPVWACVPAASAVEARRDTMTPFEAESCARSSAAAPATCAAAAEVPETEP